MSGHGGLATNRDVDVLNIRTNDLGGSAYFAWGEIRNFGVLQELVSALSSKLAAFDISFTHFTLSMDSKQTKGAKPLKQLTTHKAWRGVGSTEMREMALINFGTQEFLTVFDAKIYLGLSRGDKTAEALGFRTEEMLYRMRMDRLCFFISDAAASEEDVRAIGKLASEFLIAIQSNEVKRVADLATASLYVSGANFHVKEEFYTAQKIRDF